jgi:polysaccharide pyruvyl transferase WcaK-like protein
MTITDIFQQEHLEHSVLIGYYGGGNFGDELLLEVLMNLFAECGVESLTVTYQHTERYATYHHDFGYTRVNMADKTAVFKAVLKNKNIVIGGGGLWGLDVNPNIFILSCFLFMSRWLLRKKVYLLGVGYYNSTNRLGRISAWFAGKAANVIVARDDETRVNFARFQKHTYLDADIAWLVRRLPVQGDYKTDAIALEKRLIVKRKTLFISLRRFRPGQHNDYTTLIAQFIAQNRKQPIIVALLEPAVVDPAGYALLQEWQQKYPQLQVIDFTYNPLALLLFFKRHNNKLAVIGPQFHLIISAEIAGISFLPIAYDNKVSLLVEKLGHTSIPISQLTLPILNQFAKEHTTNEKSPHHRSSDN